jgi:hypothetical protein
LKRRPAAPQQQVLSSSHPRAFAMKIIIAIAFLLIIGSLASALLFMMRDKGKTNRTVYALMLRVGFSILLFMSLLIAYRLGLIQPTGIH